MYIPFFANPVWSSWNGGGGGGGGGGKLGRGVYMYMYVLEELWQC